jgi:D-glycero-D-manno-heptose 1,7-bisphosphate phosphatase
MTESKRRAVFLDRDGTINIDKDYLHRKEDFEFIPGAPEAIRELRMAGFMVIVVTNQSGVARGYYSEEDVETLHQHIQTKLAGYGTAVDAFYFCPHHSESGREKYRIKCRCRKGAPGMLLQAADEHGIELSESFMVGDNLIDVEAGERAGCQAILVLTGYGTAVATNPEVASVTKCADLKSAAKLIISQPIEK